MIFKKASLYVPIFLATAMAMLSAGNGHFGTKEAGELLKWPDVWTSAEVRPSGADAAAVLSVPSGDPRVSMASVADYWPAEMERQAICCVSRCYRGYAPLSELWHGRCVHVGLDTCKLVVPKECVDWPDQCDCEPCTRGKFCKASFKPVNQCQRREWLPGQYIHSDLCGPFVRSAGGARYFVLYIDDESDYVGAFLLTKKSDQKECYLKFRTLLEVRTSRATGVVSLWMEISSRIISRTARK
jgi:hypothetical protein